VSIQQSCGQVASSSPPSASHVPLPQPVVSHVATHFPDFVHAQCPTQSTTHSRPRQSRAVEHSGGGRAAQSHIMVAFEAHFPALPSVVVQSEGLQEGFRSIPQGSGSGTRPAQVQPEAATTTHRSSMVPGFPSSHP
jgi:hypothetical protein